MTIGDILRNKDVRNFHKMNNIRKITEPKPLALKLDYEGIEKGIEKMIDIRLRKSELERFITTELAYREDRGDNSIVRRKGASIRDAIRIRAPHLA